MCATCLMGAALSTSPCRPRRSAPSRLCCAAADMPWAPEWAKERDRQLRAKLELARAQRDGYLSLLQAAENRSALFKFGLLDEAANTRHALHEVNQALGDMTTARQALQIATNAMDRLANAIGMEHGAVETEDGASRLAIVQWTHTLRMRPMLLAARRQILQQRDRACGCASRTPPRAASHSLSASMPHPPHVLPPTSPSSSRAPCPHPRPPRTRGQTWADVRAPT